MAEFHRNFSLLRRACSLMMAVCVLHLVVVIFFYIRTFTTVALIQAPAVRDQRPETSARSSSSVAPTSEMTTETAYVNYCPEISPHLEGLNVNFLEPVLLSGLMKDTGLFLGGHYTPHECVSQQKVALIVPFRDREQHLKYWLFYMHPFLKRQQLDYSVYIIQQDGNETLNRAMLLNVGFVEALKDYDYDCFVFSDVDLIPIDDRNIYKCYSQPRHLSVAIDKFNFNVIFLGMSISRPSNKIGKCKMIQHARDKLNPSNRQRFVQITKTKQTMEQDGLNSLNYSVVHWEKNQLYTRITVDIGKPP